MKESILRLGESKCTFGTKYKGKTWNYIITTDARYTSYILNLEHRTSASQKFVMWVLDCRKYGVYPFTWDYTVF